MITFKRTAAAALMLAVCMLLSGCLYPRDRLEQNQRPPKDAILTVQAVIDQYQKDTGLLPILNSTEDTPVYEKYRVDFEKLQEMNYLSEIPPSAFENGGGYYFLIINEEKDPTVKLMNLVFYQQINDVQAAVKAYVGAHGGKLPAGQRAYPDFTYIDYSKLKPLKEPVMNSMFTGQPLLTMMDAQGNVYLDYGSDIMQQLNKQGAAKPEPGQDLRTLLVNGSDFVPVKSAVYRLVNGEPQAMLK